MNIEQQREHGIELFIIVFTPVFMAVAIIAAAVVLMKEFITLGGVMGAILTAPIALGFVVGAVMLLKRALHPHADW